MVIVIHDLSNDSSKHFEGDRATVMRAIDEVYPWLSFHYRRPQDLEALLADIDHQQYFSVEVLDDREHPFVQQGK